MEMPYDEESSASVGARTVFNGTEAEPMFHAETVPLPVLGPGEILVKVRLASICMSDVHTITGQRTEPTPRLLGTADSFPLISLIVVST